MKPDDGQHRVFKGINTRTVGSAPNLGPVAQLSRIGRVREGMQGRRRSHSPHPTGMTRVRRRRRTRRTVVTVWSTVVGLTAVGAMAAAFVFWLLPVLQREKDTTEKDRIAEESRARKVSRFPSPSDAKTLALVSRALEVRDPREVSNLIRPGPMSNEEVVAKLRQLRETEGDCISRVWMSSVDKNGLSLEGVELTFSRSFEVRKRLAFLTPDETGVWKLDFASFVRRVEPSWEELLSGAAKSGVVRVSIARDRYYNGPFLSENDWAAYGMVSPDIKELLVGYCKRDSAQFRSMELLIPAEESTPPIRATLDVRRVEGSDSKQFEITRVRAEDWVEGDVYFDETVDGVR